MAHRICAQGSLPLETGACSNDILTVTAATSVVQLEFLCAYVATFRVTRLEA